jgi:hypothetical protein
MIDRNQATKSTEWSSALRRETGQSSGDFVLPVPDSCRVTMTSSASPQHVNNSTLQIRPTMIDRCLLVPRACRPKDKADKLNLARGFKDRSGIQRSSRPGPAVSRTQTPTSGWSVSAVPGNPPASTPRHNVAENPFRSLPAAIRYPDRHVPQHILVDRTKIILMHNTCSY